MEIFFFFLKNVIISLLKPVLAALAHHYACTCFFSFLKPDVSIHFVIYIKSLHIYQMTFIVVVAVLNELFLFFPLENIGVTKDYVLNTLKFSHCFFSLTLWYYLWTISIWLMVPSPTQLRYTTAIILESFSFFHIPQSHLTSHLNYIMYPVHLFHFSDYHFNIGPYLSKTGNK